MLKDNSSKRGYLKAKNGTTYPNLPYSFGNKFQIIIKEVNQSGFSLKTSEKVSKNTVLFLYL